MVCTVKQAVEHFQQLDPRTPINEPYIIRLVESRAILSVQNGAEYLISTDDLAIYAHARPTTSRQGKTIKL